MHKRFPGVKNSKKIWAENPWARYLIKVEGVYIAFSTDDEAADYTPDNVDLTSYERGYCSKEWYEKRANGKAN